MKKGLLISGLIATQLALLGVIPNVNATAATTGMNETIEGKENSVTQYRSYLANYDVEEAKLAGVSDEFLEKSVKGSMEILNKFDNLTYGEQQKLVASLRQVPQLVSGSDILRSGSYGYSASKVQRSTQKTWNAKGLRFMPSLTTFFVKVNYQTKGKKVLKTTSMQAFVTRNYNYTLTLPKLSQNRHVSHDNEGYATATWGVDGNSKGYKVRLGTEFLSVAGDYKGYRAYVNHS